MILRRCFSEIYIVCRRFTNSSCRGLPPADGLRAHVELSRISGHIVCNTYRVSPWENVTDPLRHVEKAIEMLERWKADLPPRLQLLDNVLTDDPACCLLHMGYNQVRLATERCYSEEMLSFEVGHPHTTPNLLRSRQKDVCRTSRYSTIVSRIPSSASSHQKMRRCSKVEPPPCKAHLGIEPTSEVTSIRSAFYFQRSHLFNVTRSHPLKQSISGRKQRPQQRPRFRNCPIRGGKSNREQLW